MNDFKEMTDEEDEYCNDVLRGFLGREEANEYIHTDKNATPIQAEIMERIMRLEQAVGLAKLTEGALYTARMGMKNCPTSHSP